MIEPTQMEHCSASGTLKMALVGPEKSGKTTLACTAPGIKLLIDRDCRKEAVAGVKDVFALSIREAIWPLQAEAFNQMIDIVAKLEEKRTLRHWFESDAVPDTLIFDSAVTLAKAAMYHQLYCAGRDDKLMRRVTVGKQQLLFPKTWTAWGVETAMVEDLIVRSFGLGMNVIVTFHTTDEKAPDSTEEEPKYTGKETVYPVRLKILLKYFNEVWLLSRIGRTVTVQTQPDYKFETLASAITRDGTIQNPNIQDIIIKNETGIIKN